MQRARDEVRGRLVAVERVAEARLELLRLLRVVAAAGWASLRLDCVVHFRDYFGGVVAECVCAVVCLVQSWCCW